MRAISRGIERRNKKLRGVSGKVPDGEFGGKVDVGWSLPGDDGNGESSRLGPASSAELGEVQDAALPISDPGAISGVSATEGSVHVSVAGISASSESPRDIDEGTSEGEIEEHCNEAQDGDPADAADEDQGEDGEENTSARDTFYGSEVVCDVEFMI